MSALARVRVRAELIYDLLVAISRDEDPPYADLERLTAEARALAGQAEMAHRLPGAASLYRGIANELDPASTALSRWLGRDQPTRAPAIDALRSIAQAVHALRLPPGIDPPSGPVRDGRVSRHEGDPGDVGLAQLAEWGYLLQRYYESGDLIGCSAWSIVAEGLRVEVYIPVLAVDGEIVPQRGPLWIVDRLEGRQWVEAGRGGAPDVLVAAAAAEDYADSIQLAARGQ